MGTTHRTRLLAFVAASLATVPRVFGLVTWWDLVRQIDGELTIAP